MVMARYCILHIAFSCILRKKVKLASNPFSDKMWLTPPPLAHSGSATAPPPSSTHTHTHTHLGKHEAFTKKYAVLMLGQLRRRWTNIETALDECIVCAGHFVWETPRRRLHFLEFPLFNQMTHESRNGAIQFLGRAAV